MGFAERNITRRQCLAMMAATAGMQCVPTFGHAEEKQNTMHFAVSVETLAGANVNDARAAYRVWVGEVSRQLPTTTAEVVPEIFLPSDVLIRGVRQGTIEVFGITALEFSKIADLIDPSALVVQDYLADGLEYVLLVHSSSSFHKVADLRGTQLLTHLHRDMVLALPWLGTLLAANNLGAAEHFFGGQSSLDSLNRVVLPVFFRSAGAACLARRSWDTVVELNPQLGRDLRPLAISPRLIPIVICFRRNSNEAARKAVVDSILHVSSFAAGQQIIALYQSHGFVARPTSVMKGTLEMVRQYEELASPKASSSRGNSLKPD
jgi:ABC-type phosphate/phosphonate transport system substrate-binding protein